MRLPLITARHERKVADFERHLLWVMTDPEVSAADKWQAVIDLPWEVIGGETALGRAADKVVREIDADRDVILALDPCHRSILQPKSPLKARVREQLEELILVR